MTAFSKAIAPPHPENRKLTVRGMDSFLEAVTEYSLYVLVAFFPVSKAMIEIAFTTAALSWLFKKIKNREPLALDWNVSFFFLLAFAAFSILSGFVSEYPRQSLHGIVRVLEVMFLFFIVAETFQSAEQRKRLAVVAMITLSVVLLDSIFQYDVGFDFIHQRKLKLVDTLTRMTGPFKFHSVFAVYLMALALGQISFLLERGCGSWRTKAITGILVSLAVFFLFNTQSRAAWLAFSLALFFLIAIQGQKKFMLVLIGGILLALVLLPRNMIIHPDIKHKEQSLTERQVLWGRALDVIAARPWLGSGVNTFVQSYGQFDTVKSWRVQNYYSHNSFLQLAAETGIPSLCSFLAFAALFFRRCFVSLSVAMDPFQGALLKGVMAAIAGMLVFALIDNVFEPLQSRTLLWFFFGLGFALMENKVPGHEKRDQRRLAFK